MSVDMPRRVVCVDDIRRHRDEILEIAESYPGHGYFDMAGFALQVEDLPGVFTQVATVGGLKVRIRHRVLGEAVAV